MLCLPAGRIPSPSARDKVVLVTVFDKGLQFLFCSAAPLNLRHIAAGSGYPRSRGKWHSWTHWHGSSVSNVRALHTKQVSRYFASLELFFCLLVTTPISAHVGTKQSRHLKSHVGKSCITKSLYRSFFRECMNDQICGRSRCATTPPASWSLWRRIPSCPSSMGPGTASDSICLSLSPR